MGVVIPNGYGMMRIKMMQSGASVPMLITFGYDAVSAQTPTQDAIDWDALLRATGRPFAPAAYSTTWLYLGIDATRMTGTGPIVGSVVQSIAGSTTLGACPPNTAFLLSKATARGGRKGKGRCFLPPMWTAETNVNDFGVISSGPVSTMQGQWASFLTAVNATPLPAVLLHSDGSTPDPITGLTVNALAASQRRRLRR